MKNSTADKGPARLLAIILALSAGLTLSGGASQAFAAENEQPDSGRFTERMQDWQDKMSDAFRDTWRGFWKDKDAKSLNASSIASASVDLREQQDNYTVRLNLPERTLDKVEITMDGNTLHVVAPAEGKAALYRQTILLTGVAPGTQPQIERRQKDSMIVISVPKQKGAAVSAPLPLSPGETQMDAWDRDVLNLMWRMQRDMDRIFAEAFSEFRNTPQFRDVFDEPRFDSSVDLQEHGSNYVIRAYLPDRDMNNVTVGVEGQTLKIEARAENTEQPQNGSVFAKKAKYSQLLTLPGPVQAEKMMVDRKEDMLVVTLPKVSAN